MKRKSDEKRQTGTKSKVHIRQSRPRKTVSRKTPPKDRQHDLKAAEERLRLFSEAAEEGLALHDKGIIIEVNQSCARMFGYESSEMIGMDAKKLATPESWKKIKKYISSKHHKPYEGIAVRKDGSTFACALVGKPYKYKGRTLRVATFHDITESKHMEDALRTSEEKFASAFKHSPNGMCISTLQEGRYVDANDLYLSALGYRREEIIGFTSSDINLWVDMAERDVMVRELIQTGKVTDFELHFRDKKGHIRLGLISASIIKIGEESYILAQAQDITERKKMEQNLEKSEAQYHLLADHTKDQIWLMDLSLNITYISPSVEKISGYSPEEIIKKPLAKLLTEASRKLALETFSTEMSKALKNPPPPSYAVSLEWEVYHKDGHIFPFEATLSFILDENKKPLYILGEGRDITERKKAEEKMRREEQMFRSFAEQSSDIIVLADSKGRILYENPAMEKILGYKVEERIGSSGFELVHPDDMKIVIDAADILFNDTNAPVIKNELRLRHKDGSWRIFDGAASNLVHNNVVEAVIINLHDITKRKSTEERLIMTQFAMDRSSYNILWLDDSAKIIYINNASVASLGYSREELLTMTIHDIDPDFPAEAWPAHVDELRKHRFLTFESRHRKKNGKFFPVEVTCNYFEYKGRFYSLAFDLDITERKMAEEAIRQSEEKYRLLADHMKDYVWLMDLDLGITYISPSVERLMGYTLDDFKKLPLGNLLTIASVETAMNFFSLEMPKALNASPDYILNRSLELEFCCKDGRTVWGECNFSLIRDENGNPLQLLGVSRNITERKQMEDVLKRSEENFRLSLDESPLGVRISSIEGKTLYANRAILDLYGYDNIEELINTPLKKRYTPESYAEYEIRKAKRLKGETGPSEYEISIVRKDGEIRHLHVFRKEIFWNGNKQSQVIYQDVTLRRQAEEKLSHMLENLRQSVKITIQVLGTASEAKDPYMAGHQKRVADLARAIATEMKLPHDKIEAIRMAGAIHDIGKISVPSEILCKPAILSDLEFSFVKNHPRYSYDIIKEVESPWPLADIVHQHHERIDGSGYPLGLKGTDILIESRILAVADVVEAMISYRPYRPALGIEIALAEIENNAGILYDCMVVEACIKLFRGKGYQMA